jgi:hypothetical protein
VKEFFCNQCIVEHLLHIGYVSKYSIKSPGEHFNSLHNESSVENLMALALLFLRIDKLAIVIPTFDDSSVKEIRFCTINKSNLTLIGIFNNFRLYIQIPFLIVIRLQKLTRLSGSANPGKYIVDSHYEI